MIYEVISTKVSKEQIQVVKNTIELFKNKHSSSKISQSKTGFIGDQILMSFKVDLQIYEEVVGSLLKQNISVLFSKSLPQSTQQIVSKIMDTRKVQSQISDLQSNKTFVDSGKRENKYKFLTILNVDNLIEEGNYQELQRIARSINCDPKVAKHASYNIKKTALKKIRELEYRGIKSSNMASESINKLIEIASDKSLTLFDVELQKTAGNAAVTVCVVNEDSVDQLIKICNNNSMHYSTTMDAATKFSEIVFSDEIKFKDELFFAKKSLSKRRLSIAYDIGNKELEQNQKDRFSQLIEYLNS